MSRRERVTASGKKQRKQLKRRPTSGKRTSRHSPLTHSQNKFNDRIRNEFIDAIREGLPPSIACDLVGISVVTFTRWMAKGKDYQEQLEDNEQNDHHLMYFNFYRGVQKAKAEFLLDFIRRMGRDRVEKEWYRNISVLERRDPTNWGRKANITITDDAEAIYSPDEEFL